jgi:hypothetical protein
VARVALEAVEHATRHARHPPAVLAIRATHQLLDQERQVLQPLAQRRELHPCQRELVVEVVAEAPGAHRVRQLAVARGHDTHVRAPHARAAHALERALLEEAQQPHLHRHRRTIHLVHEQRAAVGALERAARARGLRAEQLDLEHRSRQLAAAHALEAALAPRAVVVERARDHALPRARLALQQHRRARRREVPHLVAHALDGARVPGERAHAELAVEPVLHLDHALGEPQVLEPEPERRQQLLAIDRLDLEVVGATPHRLERDRARLGARQHHRAQRGLSLARAIEHREPVESGAASLGDEAVRARIVERIQRRLGVAHAHALESVRAEERRQRPPGLGAADRDQRVRPGLGHEAFRGLSAR